MAQTENIIARQSIQKRERRRLASGLNTLAAIALACALVAMLNYVSARHYKRFDLSQSKFYELSDKTRSLLASLTGRVDVVVLFQSGQAMYEYVDNLAREYEYASKNIRVERIDPDRDLAKTEEVARRYNAAHANVVVFSFGDRTKFVSAADLQDIDYSAVLEGGQPEMTAFKGEQAFSSAIDEVTRGRVPVVYFLTGHGEGDVEDRDPAAGYSDIRREIEHDNAVVRVLKLGDAQVVPEDADCVVIAGATRRIPQAEVDVLRRYLERSGRLVVLLSGVTDPALEELLGEWGVRAGNDIVVDPSHTLSGQELFLDGYGRHPITKNLKDLTSVFYRPRSVEPAASGPDATQADKPQVEALLRSAETAWAETDMDQKPMRFDAARDRKGPLSVAVAVEKGSLANLDVEISPTRLVVFGDSDFVSNFAALSAANADLFLSALNWVLEREELLAIAPKGVQDNRLVMDDVQLRLLFWCVVIGVPGIVAIIGGAVWYRRRA
ncbi:MAG TPA: GldG family protein [Kiritimatiellia bacterium]|jgi:ABC-type uncharacterized transport system involved in gliding motility auxiliary subunit